MGVFNDISGNKYGRLTAIRKVSLPGAKRTKWLCLCECGREKEILRQSLIGGLTKSCGCISKKYNKPESYQLDLYKLWHTMIRRCYNPKTNGYKTYKKRNITVCNEWQGKDGFVNFTRSMGERPSKKHSIDRIDNDKGYYPENCRWATAKQQANNRVTNHYIDFSGVKLTLKQWSEKMGVPERTICERLSRGWDECLAIIIPPNLKYREKKFILDNYSSAI